MIKQIFYAVALGVACFAAPNVQAGSTAAANAILPKAQVAQFSDRVQKILTSKGANVAIVSRMGRDPATMPDGITYTHVAFWVYSNIELVAGLRGRGTAFTICIKTAKTNHAVR